MHHTVWHGTNQDFEIFDPEMLGQCTSNTASTAAFFFAMNPETAWDYALSAARKLVPGHLEHEARVAELLAHAHQALGRRDDVAYENLIISAENMEAKAMQAPPAGATLMLCELSLDNPLTVSGRDRQVFMNLGGLLEDARDNGHDGIIIRDMQDTPSGIAVIDDHFAVFDPSSIRFVDRAMNLEDAHRIPRGMTSEPDHGI